MDDFTMFGSLKRCVDRGLNINTVIDIGASNGCWTRECLKLLPDSKYLLIEAQEPHKKDLIKLCEERPNIEYVLAAAGNVEGKIFFDNSELFGGAATEIWYENCIEVNSIKVDDETNRKKLNPPYLMKLDTHGFEVPIIEGSIKTLKNTELIIIEAYNYQIKKDSLKFYQLCEYMDNLGFFPIEIVDPFLRKYDNSFWQMDIFFIPKNRKEFEYNCYE